MYTYFIISPGAEFSSFVGYAKNVRGNYVKFGDASELHTGLEFAMRISRTILIWALRQ
jgi:hypothetical protein